MPMDQDSYVTRLVTKAVERVIAVTPETGRQPRHPRVHVRLQCCGACSRTAPGPTARCTARRARLGLDARERALATRLAYGAVQRRATLDHLIETLAGRPVERLEPLVARRAAARRSTSSPTSTACPRTRPSGESVELVKRDSPGGAKLVNAVLRRARARGAGAASPRSATPRPPQAALRALAPRVDRRAVVGGARAGRRARADGRRQRAGRGRAARQHAARRPGRAGGARCRSPTRPAPGPARGARARRPVRRVRARRCGSAARFMPQSRAAMTRRAAARAAARRARARPVRRARRQDDAPRGADGGTRASSSRSSATPAAPTRCGARPRAWAPRRGRGPHRRRRRAARAGRLRPRARRPAVLGPRHARLAARRALAQGRRSLPERLAREQAAILRAGADALRPGGTLVYSTCTISPAENEAVVQAFLAERDGLRGRRPARRRAAVGACARARLRPDAPAPRRDRGLLHRPPAPRGRP